MQKTSSAKAESNRNRQIFLRHCTPGASVSRGVNSFRVLLSVARTAPATRAAGAPRLEHQSKASAARTSSEVPPRIAAVSHTSLSMELLEATAARKEKRRVVLPVVDKVCFLDGNSRDLTDERFLEGDVCGRRRKTWGAAKAKAAGRHQKRTDKTNSPFIVSLSLSLPFFCCSTSHHNGGLLLKVICSMRQGSLLRIVVGKFVCSSHKNRSTGGLPRHGNFLQFASCAKSKRHHR